MLRRDEFACKSIAKTKLATQEDVDDVRRKIQIMHRWQGIWMSFLSNGPMKKHFQFMLGWNFAREVYWSVTGIGDRGGRALCL